MAQHQTVVLVDDLDGTAAEQTVVFSVDGQQYEIDLSRHNLQRLRDILAPYVTRARQVGPAPGARRRVRQPRTLAPVTVPVTVPATAPAATGAPPAEAAASHDSTTSAPGPSVPVALFSNPDVHRPSSTAAAPKPYPAALFSTTG